MVHGYSFLATVFPAPAHRRRMVNWHFFGYGKFIEDTLVCIWWIVTWTLLLIAFKWHSIIETMFSFSCAVCCNELQCVPVYCGVLQCLAVRCGMLQCVAVCCSALQCVAEGLFLCMSLAQQMCAVAAIFITVAAIFIIVAAISFTVAAISITIAAHLRLQQCAFVDLES